MTNIKIIFYFLKILFTCERAIRSVNTPLPITEFLIPLYVFYEILIKTILHMKTIFKFAIRNTAKLAGYTYGYSSVYATFSKACGDKIAELEINAELDKGIKAEKGKKKKGK